MTQIVQPLTTFDFATRATFLSCRTTLRSEPWTFGLQAHRDSERSPASETVQKRLTREPGRSHHLYHSLLSDFGNRTLRFSVVAELSKPEKNASK
jgi:hypothetical protein